MTDEISPYKSKRKDEQQFRSSSTKTIKVDSHSALLIRHALVKRLQLVDSELETLMIAKKRNLTTEERWRLPGNLQLKVREELKDQIDPWISLKHQLEDLIKEFTL